MSINSNIPGYDTAYFTCNEKPEILIDDFVKWIYKNSLKAEELNKIKYRKNFKFLEHQNGYEDEKSLYSQFFRWMVEVPVLSFNGSKYDINLIS